MGRKVGLRLVIACAAAAAAIAVGWLLLPKARAAPTGEAAPTAAASAPEVSEAEAILREVVALREKLDAYAMQPGWTLLRYEQHDHIAWNSPRPLPQRHERETWLHFNENRQVYQSVEYALAPELGKVLLGYQLNGEGVSVWHGERYTQAPYSPKLQLGLEYILRGVIEDGRLSEITSREDVVEEAPVWVIDMKYAYSAEARQFSVGFDPPVWGRSERCWLDRETGIVLRFEGAYILEDGTLVPSGGLETRQIRANVEPPAEVLEVLRKAAAGEDVR